MAQTTETPQWLLPDDGPCGCRGMHPGQTHTEHVDAIWRKQNAAMLDTFVELRVSDPPRALLALLGHAAEETARLGEKAVLMESGRWP